MAFVVRMVFLIVLFGATGAFGQSHIRQELSLKVDGRTRSYVLYAPANPEAPPKPLVIALHPGLSSGAKFEQASGLTNAAGAGHLTFAFPDGFKGTWNAGGCCGQAQERGIDDVKFITALIDELSKHPGIDTRNVFLTGFSNGTKMSYRLACERPDLIRAMAPYGSSMDLSPGIACRPSRPVPILHIHGLLDKVAPFEGGPSSLKRVGIQPSARKTVEFWTQVNGCRRAKPSSVIPGASCVTYDKCAAETSLCTIEGLGHQWPGFEAGPLLRRTLGPDRPDIHASDAILGFFFRHVK